jgi:hypothetical protein
VNRFEIFGWKQKNLQNRRIETPVIDRKPGFSVLKSGYGCRFGSCRSAMPCRCRFMGQAGL